MADGLFVIGTDRGVGKTLLGVGIVALLQEMGVDATILTPIVTGGSVEKPDELFKRFGLTAPKHQVNPVNFETLASPYVASQIEHKSVDIEHIISVYHQLKAEGKFVVVIGTGLMVPIARRYYMIDLLGEFDLPSIIIGRTSRGTLNQCMMTLRLMLAMGETPEGFILNGFGQYGDGFAESLNPDTLGELAHPIPVLATIERRPAYQNESSSLINALKSQPALIKCLKKLTKNTDI